MKITGLTWPSTHPVLPSLHIDLAKPDGTPYEVVVLAGDNGIGKTTILQSIHNLISGKSCDLEKFEYKINNDKFIAARVDVRHISVAKNGGLPVNVQLNDYPGEDSHDFGEFSDMDAYAPQNYKSVFSTATTDFQTSDQNHSDQYDGIRRMLITLENQDNEAYRAVNKELEARSEQLLSVSVFNARHSKVERFRNAFNKFFEGLKFDRVKSESDHSRILFTKSANEEIDIEALSTGEQQIVYRGSDLLSQAADSNIALIDEPEISMHPRWMKKILGFYTDLLRNPSAAHDSAQIFIVTHSDILLQTAHELGVLILRLTKNGTIVECNKPDTIVLSSPTAAEINYVVFGLATTDYHIQLFAQLHNEISANKHAGVNISEVDKSIEGQPQYGTQYNKHYEYQFKDRRTGHTKTSSYETLPCYVRNCIDHPNSPDTAGNIQTYSETELQESIKFLRELINAQKNGSYDYTK